MYTHKFMQFTKPYISEKSILFSIIRCLKNYEIIYANLHVNINILQIVVPEI